VRIGYELLKVVGKLQAKAQTQNSYPDARVSELLDGRRCDGLGETSRAWIKGPPMHLLRSFLKCERGATAIEYAIIAGGIALAIVAGVKSIGTPLNDTFTSVAGGVK
jgi:pilus assembly protein Flp/PilA